MALSTPILTSISTFDPSEKKIISFQYTDGQIQKKRLVISNNKTSEVVVDSIQVGMRTEYELAAKTLTVGQYTAQIQVFDFDGNQSELSAPILFYCSTTPSVTFKNFKSKVGTANVTFTLGFSQKEGEKFKEALIYLYDMNKSELKKSDSIYTTANLKCTFNGLKNKRTYYVRCIGKCVNGIPFDTGYKEFFVDYITHPNNMLLELINNRMEGYITISTNIIDIGYDTDGTYEVKDGCAILDEGKVTYNYGFDFSDNFSMFLHVRHAKYDQTFFSFKSTSGDTEVKFKTIGGINYCVLTAPSPLGDYVLYRVLPDDVVVNSSTVSAPSGKNIRIEIHRKYDLYDLTVVTETI